jgi:hypothetical protein
MFQFIPRLSQETRERALAIDVGFLFRATRCGLPARESAHHLPRGDDSVKDNDSYIANSGANEACFRSKRFSALEPYKFCLYKIAFLL